MEDIIINPAWAWRPDRRWQSLLLSRLLFQKVPGLDLFSLTGLWCFAHQSKILLE